MPSMHYQYCLTNIEKKEIIVLSKNISHTEIDKELHIPRIIISSFLQRLKNQHSPYNLPHPSRPRKTSATFDQWLIRTALTETKMPFKELKSIANIPVSEQTIRRRLKEKDICRNSRAKSPSVYWCIDIRWSMGYCISTRQCKASYR